MRLFLTVIPLLCHAVTVLTAALDVASHEEINRRSMSDNLRGILSPGATIAFNTSRAPRWSDYDAPMPGLVVNVATEQDVQVVVSSFIVGPMRNQLISLQVQYAVKYNVPFLAQSGGHGWINSFHLGSNGVLLNMRGINKTTFSADKKQARVQGGAIVSDLVAAAYAAGVQILTGNCNCVGVMGSSLGGGYGNLLGIYGFAVDNILSLDVVLANGTLTTISPKTDADLFWALRGAGPNFGIVTAATFKSFPATVAQNTAWIGSLVFTPDKIEKLVQALQDLVLKPQMNVLMYYLVFSGTPVVLLTPFYYGTEADAKAAYASIYAIGVYMDLSVETTYDKWNDGSNGFCVHGGRKPGYGAGFANMVPSTWRAIWNSYTNFLKNPGTNSSVVILEAYPSQRLVPATQSAFPYRDVRFNGVALPWYSDKALDPKAEAFGSSVRNMWRASDGLPGNET